MKAKIIYMELIKKYSKNGEIKWIDRYITDDMASLYFSASDVVALPYKSASQSGVIPLSYSYNRPVIASDISGIREMVDHEKTGFLFNRNDEKDLSDKIIKYFNSGIDFKNNIIEFKKRFEWDSFITELLNLSKTL